MRRWLVGGVWVVSIGVAILSFPGDLALLPTAVLCLTVGTLIVLRVPGNGVGPLLLGLGASIPLQNGAWAVMEARPMAPDALWWSALYVDLAIGIVAPAAAFIGIPLLVPSGRPWWPWLWRLALIYVGGYLAASVLLVGTYSIGFDSPIANPMAVVDLEQDVVDMAFFAIPLMAAFAVGAAVSRYRTSSDIERAQLRAFVSIIALAVGLLLFTLPLWLLGVDSVGLYSFSIATALLPFSIGVAVLKYRLYDVGRLVSRTLTYAVLVGLVAAGYAIGAVWLPTRLGLTDDPLWVAGTTLVLALAFHPVRRRLTTWLDRRFNRTPYDPDAVADGLTTRLRATTDPGQILDAWAQSANSALQPDSIRVWISAG